MIQVGTSVPWVCVKQELSSILLRKFGYFLTHCQGNLDIFLHMDYLLLHKNWLTKNCVFPVAY